MTRNRKKNRAGKHKPILKTDEVVHVPGGYMNEPYTAHRYDCGSCGARFTRRTLRVLSCPPKPEEFEGLHAPDIARAEILSPQR